MIKFLQHRPYLFWTLVGALVYIPFLGASHLFDWDEINFAESAREMIVSGDYVSVQINFLPFWENLPCLFGCRRLVFCYSPRLQIKPGFRWNSPRVSPMR